jgi:hypothetical protein
MLHFLVRGCERKSYELRLCPDGEGFELIVDDENGRRVERFTSLDGTLAREQELLGAWRASGWQDPPTALRKKN